MGGRYLLTGSQIGCILTLSEQNDYIGVKKILKEIQDNQFLGDSKTNVQLDSKGIELFFTPDIDIRISALITKKGIMRKDIAMKETCLQHMQTMYVELELLQQYLLHKIQKGSLHFEFNKKPGVDKSGP